MEYHKKIIFSGIVIFSIILVSSFDEFIFAQENSWEVLPSMDISRSDYTGVVVDTKIYLIQGIGAEDNFTFFDTSTGLFTELTPAPYYAHHSASAIHDGKIYLAGGCNFGHPCPTVAVYDISSNKWSSLPAMPVPTWAAAAEIVNNEFFVMGGSPNEKTCQKYSIATNSWSICADLPTGREHLSSAVYENKIYVINGRGGGPGDLTANEVYDPITDTWEILADKPTGMAGGSAGTFKNKIFVIGGEGPLTGANEWYDPATDSWTSGPDMPTPRHGLVCEPSGSKIYCFGGGAVEGGGKSAIVEVFDTNSMFETLVETETKADSPSLEIVVTPNSTQIPDWIKQNAKWWADGKIDDSTFLLGIQFMINNKIISIPDLPESAESSNDSLPAWIKNNARWWADGKIREDDFVNGIKYLVENGIIQVRLSDSIDVKLDKPFELSIDQTVNIESENLSISLLDVYNDSRCPVDVTCVWQGEATALIEITDSNNEVSEMELQWLSKTTFDFDGSKYEIHFEDLKPDNYTTKDVSDQPYKATFTIWIQN